MSSDTPLFFSSASRVARRWVPRNRGTVLAALVLLAIAIPCILAPLVAPYDPLAISREEMATPSQPPSVEHRLGTDPSSRDVLSRLLYGGRLSLSVAVFATIVSVTLGTAYGAAAGYSRGLTGAVLERVLDALLSIPRLLLLIAIFALWDDIGWWDDIGLKGFVVILGLTGWYGVARLVRGQVLALRAQDFVASARALGATPGRIFLRHVLPNVLTPVVVAATLGIGHVIILEAGLSYLGIGVDPPTPSWGNMIQEGSGTIELRTNWWMSLFPGLAIVLTVMAFNVLGEALLRALQPRQQTT